MNSKPLTVHEVAELTGITVRTLHYYDEIGLLKSSIVTDAKYRLYTESDLSNLQEILFFREVGFALKEIKKLLNSPSYDRKDALGKQLQILDAQRDRIDGLIELVKREISGVEDYSFNAFSNSKILDLQAEFREEIIQRWGETDSYKEFEAVFSKKARKSQQGQFDAFLTKTQNVFENLSMYEDKDPAYLEVQSIVKEWQDYISEHFYQCDMQMLIYLGELYVSDERFSDFINRFGNGNLATFFNEAIKIYCSQMLEHKDER